MDILSLAVCRRKNVGTQIIRIYTKLAIEIAPTAAKTAYAIQVSVGEGGF
jgi:hypothetical protein